MQPQTNNKKIHRMDPLVSGGEAHVVFQQCLGKVSSEDIVEGIVLLLSGNAEARRLGRRLLLTFTLCATDRLSKGSGHGAVDMDFLKNRARACPTFKAALRAVASEILGTGQDEAEKPLVHR